MIKGWWNCVFFVNWQRVESGWRLRLRPDSFLLARIRFGACPDTVLACGWAYTEKLSPRIQKFYNFGPLWNNFLRGYKKFQKLGLSKRFPLVRYKISFRLYLTSKKFCIGPTISNKLYPDMKFFCIDPSASNKLYPGKEFFHIGPTSSNKKGSPMANVI